MTIDHQDIAPMRRTVRFVAAAAGVLAIWFLALAGVVAAFEPEATVLVFGPERALLRALAGSDTRLVSTSTGLMRVRGVSPGFVRQLYANGAWFVVPGTAFGCGAGGNTSLRTARAF